MAINGYSSFYLCRQLSIDNTLMIVTQIIHQNITHSVNFRKFGALLVGYRIVTDAGSEKDVAESINNKAINFLRHGDIKRTSTCSNMCQKNALLLGNDTCCHGRSQIVNDNDCISRILLKIKFKLRHHTTCEFIKVFTVNSKKLVGTFNSKFIEERLFKSRIIFRTSIHQSICRFISVFTTVNSSYNWRNLDKIWSCATENTNIHWHILF